MAVDYNLLGTIRDYLRMKYATDVTGLRRLADETFAAATETVTLTSGSFEGGSHAGVMNCPKGLLLQAIMDVLKELDATIPRAPIAAVFLSR